VRLHNDVKKVGECSKFGNEFLKTPFRIVELNGTHSVRLQNTVTGKIMKTSVHVDRIQYLAEKELPTHSKVTDGSTPTMCTSPTLDHQGSAQSIAKEVIKTSQESQDEPILPSNLHNQWTNIDNVYAVRKLLKIKGTGIGR
jgi:hypothetical protein